MSLRIGLAQVNTIVGNIKGNVDIIADMINAAQTEGVDLVIFPEMCVCGYPPEDLLHKPAFLLDNEAALKDLAARTDQIAAVIGSAQGSPEKCYNTATVLDGGQAKEIYQKGLLPNYSVFD
ncbi:MAG: nitrilase-related carbon-nitrogen hydrolase, partial [Planctomycetota bacterium]